MLSPKPNNLKYSILSLIPTQRFVDNSSQKKNKAITEKLRANCSQTTGERLNSSAAIHALVGLVSAWLKGREVSTVGPTGWATIGGGIGTTVGGRWEGDLWLHGTLTAWTMCRGGVSGGGGGGGGGEKGLCAGSQFLRTAFHTLSTSMQNSFCEFLYFETSEGRSSKRT